MWLGVLASAAAQVAAPLAAPFTVLTAPLLVYVQRVAHVTASPALSVVELHVVARRDRRRVVGGGGAAALAVRALAAHACRGAARGAARSAGGAGSRSRAAAVAAAACSAAPQRPARRRARHLVPRHRPGRRDADPARRRRRAGRHRPARRADPRAARARPGSKRLDALMLTHAETDHEGAAAAVIRAYAPKLVVDGGAGWPSPVQRAARRSRSQRPRAGGGRDDRARRLSFACSGRRRAPPAGARRQSERQRAGHPPGGGRALDAAHRGRGEPGARAARPTAGGRPEGLPSRQRRSRAPGAARATQAADRRDRGRPAQHLRSPGAVDPRRALRAPSRRSSGPTATAPSACTPRRAGCGRGVSQLSAGGHRATGAAHAGSGSGHETVTHPSGAPVRLCAVSSDPLGKGLLRREISSFCVRVSGADHRRRRGAGRASGERRRS